LFRRTLALSMSLTLLGPAVALAQSAKAGIVTTLEGNVTARRVAMPGPVPLKFKDDVYLQDTITTGDQSLARMLLGGKAVVTVRERSVLTITETPGKSTIEIDSGKFALAVAREKMRQGEEIVIRTPNAIAGVRGTVVVTEVERKSAQAGGPAPAALTSFYVLRGTIVAQQLDPNTRQPAGAPLQVGAMQGYSQAGGAAPRVTPVPAEQVGQITAGLQPSGPKSGGDAGKEQVKVQAVQTAVSLLSALTGSETPLVIAPTPAAATGVAGTSTGATESTSMVTPPVAETAADVADSMQLGSIVLSGTQVRTATTPLVALNGEVVSSVGGQPLIAVAPGADITLASSLADVRNSEVTGDGSGLDVRGRIRSSFTGAFIALDPTYTLLDGNVISVIGAGAGLTLAGPLLTDEGGFLVNGSGGARAFFAVLDGGTVTGSSIDPFISLNGSTVVTEGSFINVRRSGPTPSRVSLAGPLLDAKSAIIGAYSATLLDQAGAPRLCCSLFAVGQGAQLDSSTTSPLVSLAETTVLTGQHVFVVFDTTSVLGEASITAPGTVTLAGPLLTTSAGTAILGLSDFLGVFRSSLGSTSTAPLVTLRDTAVQQGGVSPINGSTTAGRFLHLNGSADLPATLALAGPLLDAAGSMIFTTDDVFGVFNQASLASSTSSPLIAIDDGHVTAGRDGSFFITGSGSQVTLAGPLLAAGNSTLESGSDVVPSPTTPPFIAFRDGARLTGTGGSALVSLAGSTVDSAGNFFDVRRDASVSLAGPLLSADDSHIDTTTLGFGSACCNLVRLGQGGSLVSTSTAPLIQLSSSTVNAGPDAESGAHVVRIADAGSTASEPAWPAHVTLAGPLIAATNSTLSSLVHTLSLERSTLGSTTTAPLIQLTSSTVVAGGTNVFTGLEEGGHVVMVRASTTSGGTGSEARLTLAGPLVNATDSRIDTLSNLVGVFNGGVLTGGGPTPLISVVGSTLDLGRTSDDGDIIDVQGVGGPSGAAGSTASVPAGLLGIKNGTTTLTGGFARLGGGGELVSTHPTQPLVSIDGGTHTMSNTGRAALRLVGRPANVANETVSGNTLTLGTDQPLRHTGSGAFIQAEGGATVNAQRIVSVDTALLEASAPLLRLSGSGTSLTAVAGGLDLVSKAKLTSTGSLFRVDGATLAFMGDAVRAMSGSLLNVGGDLFHITGGGQVSIANGAALFANGGSVVNISGAIVNFASGPGTFTLANTLCSGGGCVNIGGVNVLLQNSAIAGNVSVNNPIKNAGGGSTTIGANAAVIVVNGATTKVTVSGN
jgi:hypothetical protein